MGQNSALRSTVDSRAYELLTIFGVFAKRASEVLFARAFRRGCRALWSSLRTTCQQLTSDVRAAYPHRATCQTSNLRAANRQLNEPPVSCSQALRANSASYKYLRAAPLRARVSAHRSQNGSGARWRALQQLPRPLRAFKRFPALKIRQALQVPNSSLCLETSLVAATKWRAGTLSLERGCPHPRARKKMRTVGNDTRRLLDLFLEASLGRWRCFSPDDCHAVNMCFGIASRCVHRCCKISAVPVLPEAASHHVLTFS